MASTLNSREREFEPQVVYLAREFEARYGAAARIFRAPGRVNLIGEHTDYNDGFVMPAAIQFATWVAASRRSDRLVRLYSRQFRQSAEFHLDSHPGIEKQWANYVWGVAAVLESNGYQLQGADLLISGEVPIGSGLSSSAALEVSSGFALARLAGHNVGLPELARLSQRAEHQYVGTRCGIMDQFISTQGKRGYALLLDCRTLQFEPLPLPQEMAVVICNTMVKHDLATGEYNVRRAQCEEGVRVLSARMPGIKALRDVSSQALEQHRELLDPVIYRRCRHVTTENERVLRSAEVLKDQQYDEFGRLMYSSHASLRDDYEVSCPELDAMVEIAAGQPGCLGARMTGGGFGGCTVNLVRLEALADFEKKIKTFYEQQTGKKPDIYVTQASNGVEEVLNPAAQPVGASAVDSQGEAS